MNTKSGAIKVRYRIDASQSQFIVRAFAEGFLSMFGHDPVIAVCGFGGDVRLASGTLEASSLLLLVQSDSLAVIGDVKEKDRREMERAIREDILETSRFAEIVFMSSGVTAKPIDENQFQVEINGDLSLHGVTNKQTINAQVSLTGETLRAQGEFSLRQNDYHIELVSVAGGTLKVKDELKISFDIIAQNSN
ncbi:MAG: hypothetical protein NVSMB56_16060 [Pyrinomonadaceae bacterium]